MSVQLCYVDLEWYAWRENFRHGVSAFAKSIPGVRQMLDWARVRSATKGDDVDSAGN